jgi:hypothetical protein
VQPLALAATEGFMFKLKCKCKCKTRWRAGVAGMATVLFKML